MASSYDIGPYDPCPCGSGAKYKFCCAAKAKANRHWKFPIGTVAYYGPDEKTTTKIAAGVVLRDGAEAIIERWVGSDVLHDAKVAEQVKRFFATHGVKSVVVTSGNIGCPHEQPHDFPRGQDCPFCPFWAGKQGTAARGVARDDDFDDSDDDQLDDQLDDELDDEDDEFDEADDPGPRPSRDWDAAFARVGAILGDREIDFDGAIDVLFDHLRDNLRLPCEVTGIEDFRWEEPYVIGGWSPREYKRLKKTRPSYADRYQLLAIDKVDVSEWMMHSEDIAARVRRISDGKEFILGLSELEATDKQSPNHQLLDDYAVWFANSR